MDDFKAITWRPGTDLPLLLDGKIDSEVTVYNNEVVAWGIEHPELKLKVPAVYLRSCAAGSVANNARIASKAPT